MEFGTLVPLYYLTLCCSMTFPLFGGTVISLMARNETKKPLAQAILLSGLTVGTIATLFQLLLNLSSAGGGSFTALLLNTSFYFYLAFGVGTITATVIGVLSFYVISRISGWQKIEGMGT